MDKIYRNHCIADFASDFWQKIDLDNSLNAILNFIEKYENSVSYGTLDPKRNIYLPGHVSHPGQISHSIKNMYISDNKIYGTVIIYETYFGNTLKTIIEYLSIDTLIFRPTGYFDEVDSKLIIKEIKQIDIFSE